MASGVSIPFEGMPRAQLEAMVQQMKTMSAQAGETLISVNVRGEGLLGGAKAPVGYAASEPNWDGGFGAPALIPSKDRQDPEPEAKPWEGNRYWHDPSDYQADQGYIYVVTKGSSVPRRILLSEARSAQLVPPNASIGTMSHYDNRLGKVVERRGTHEAGGHP